MTTLTTLLVLVPIIALVLIVLNGLIAPIHSHYTKRGVVECGLNTLTNQSRQPFTVVFYIVAVLFTVFDVEIVLIWPLSLVLNTVGLYGFWVGTLFFAVLTLGFIVELASGALQFDKH